MDTKASPLEFLASFVLPESILDWFEVIDSSGLNVPPVAETNVPGIAETNVPAVAEM